MEKRSPSIADQQAAFVVWLRERLGAAVEITEWQVPEGIGHSNETVLVGARVGSEAPLSLVVRVQAAEPAVFPTYDLGLQCECMRQVAAHSSVPVPTVRWLETDSSVLGRPFYVMDRIEGSVPADRVPHTAFGWLHDATPEQQELLYRSSLEVMARLHQIDWRAAGMTRLDRSEYGAVGLGQQVAWWRSYVAWVCDGREQPTIDAATAWLGENLPQPTHATVLNWGDARISNIMYRDYRPVAVLDWEMATLGPAEVDLAWFLFFQAFFSRGMGVADLPGFLPREQAIACYEQLLGRKLDDLRFYDVFAAWRFSALMLRIADLYEHRGILPPGTGAGQNNIATRMLAQSLDLPSPGPPGGPLG
jgi:aminoglycoside phosphotransferase (APT) family kinase protein